MVKIPKEKKTQSVKERNWMSWSSITTRYSSRYKTKRVGERIEWIDHWNELKWKNNRTKVDFIENTKIKTKYNGNWRMMRNELFYENGYPKDTKRAGSRSENLVSKWYPETGSRLARRTPSSILEKGENIVRTSLRKYKLPKLSAKGKLTTITENDESPFEDRRKEYPRTKWKHRKFRTGLGT